MRKLAIVGSRDYPSLDLVREFVRSLRPDTVVVSGGARGVDRVAVDEAQLLCREWEVFEADWSKGRSAGFERNVRLVGEVDGLVAFWDGKSRGTKHSIDLARTKGIWFRIFGPDGEIMPCWETEP